MVEVNGRRLPKEVAEYALANDLTDEQLNEYEEGLIEQEQQDETEFLRRSKGMKMRYEQRNSLRSSNGNFGDEEAPQVFDFEDGAQLGLPMRPNRLFYFNFQQGALTGRGNTRQSPRVKILSPKSLFSRVWSTRGRHAGARSGASSAANSSPVSMKRGGGNEDDIYVNRHLKSTEVMEKRPLSESDSELLRCIGLDTFVMIRFLRFCFDVTFYPFVLSFFILIPTYYTNDYNGQVFEDNRFQIVTQTDGYFRFTMNRLGKILFCFAQFHCGTVNLFMND